MSLDTPNEYECAIEDYAEAVREEVRAAEANKLATERALVTTLRRQELWRVVRQFMDVDKIKPGIYRLKRGPGLYQDGLLLERNHDYPDIFPMFR